MDSASDKVEQRIHLWSVVYLKAFGPERPIWEADERRRGQVVSYESIGDIAPRLKMKEAAK